ncbi:FAD:protein FMN transferase [Burkholderia pseudomallei]|uniref:FAD:protein FMN transferase n=1 Tax=Burkholderia pseudomallei TaxID=28450 RepID=UPI00048199DA|nr:FAD:protein FMN transferase [Burkholderia pseudomallei]ARK92522.1 thiamine biosynthesis protein ApbE [Burkholderia pseudomallei]ARL19739.1 thiamine biosynthesis protein ApbE [Burkholderia pseudomallei]ARL57442.1 thiamine biosynthesis protein ApbE [Burkholderia pseudomallei]ARL63889.1 thiamine biosynthesis protein ApbE [Burkholderia pseudomallei]ARL91894.1 thiamine biosynthesis protein ApbE [Burkholderia pseudomallei]
MSKTSIEWSPGARLNRCRASGATMGTRYGAQFYAPPTADARAIAAALDAAVRAVDAQMSNWKADSDLSRLNRATPGSWTPICANLAAVLVRAREIGRETDNAFNIGVGTLVDRWGFGPGAAANRQADNEWAANRQAAGRHTVDRHTVDRRTVARHMVARHMVDRHTADRQTKDGRTPDRQPARPAGPANGLSGAIDARRRASILRGPVPSPCRPIDELLEVDVARGRARRLADVAFDLCGIAKGFGVDELARVLDRHGIGAWLVGIDGELRARGCKPDGSPWAIALEAPDYGRRGAMGAIDLVDAAVATSGDYRHWADFGGERLSHTMDPRAGAPLRGDIASVTVVAPTCTDADAYATALMVLGAQAGRAHAERHGLDALFVVRDGDALRTIGCGAFADAGPAG